MNAIAIFPNAEVARLKRIKTISQIVRYAVLAILILSFVSFLLVAFPTWRLDVLKQHPVWFVIVSLPQLVLWFWYWKLAKLFYYYERGLIFAAETIRCIKTLGILCVLSWILLTIGYFISDHHAVPHSTATPPHAIFFSPIEMFRMVFFNFSIGRINFGLLLAGIVIMIIAWVMDEGRKIREEQELTV